MYSRRCEKKGWIETSAGRDVAIIWRWVLRAHRSQSQQMMGNDESDGKEARQLFDRLMLRPENLLSKC